MNLKGIGSSGKKGVIKPHLCKECGENNPSKFYNKMRIHCKVCHSRASYAIQKQRRIDAIEYKGGKCEMCGYDKYHGALQFHHKDPSKKDPKAFRKTFKQETYFAEIDKCMLLCSNCHAEEHERIRQEEQV